MAVVCGNSGCRAQVEPPRVYCGNPCRQAAHRARKERAAYDPVVPLGVPVSGSAGLDYGPPGALEDAVREELSGLTGGDRVAGALALTVARQLDRNLGLSGLGPAVNVLLTAYDRARAGAAQRDQLDELAARVVHKFG